MLTFTDIAVGLPDWPKAPPGVWKVKVVGCLWGVEAINQIVISRWNGLSSCPTRLTSAPLH